MTRIALITAAGLLMASAANAADFTVTITDVPTLAGITAARTAYCASLPPTVTTDKNGVTTSTPAVCDLPTDAAYFTSRMLQAAQSYAKQYDTAGTLKQQFLATLPPTKQASVDAAVKAELAKP